MVRRIVKEPGEIIRSSRKGFYSLGIGVCMQIGVSSERRMFVTPVAVRLATGKAFRVESVAPDRSDGGEVARQGVVLVVIGVQCEGVQSSAPGPERDADKEDARSRRDCDPGHELGAGNHDADHEPECGCER
ncbi:MAG: hypothetical protein EA398_07635 [Deltaproteobacteria bacterium]|nr:MAG: hypothetical protein EA398_07635 [Deltaproteobacteria bacterium]